MKVKNTVIKLFVTIIGGVTVGKLFLLGFIVIPVYLALSIVTCLLFLCEV